MVFKSVVIRQTSEGNMYLLVNALLFAVPIHSPTFGETAANHSRWV